MIQSMTNSADLEQQQRQQQHLWMQQYQQQWMAVQYPAAAMVMQNQMMYPPRYYMPYHHQQPYQYHPQQQQQSSPQIQGSGEENRTIWVGDLQQWMDEAYLNSCFTNTGEVSSVKVIRNKQTGQIERYGFVEFLSHAAAEKALQTLNGTIMPNTEQNFRLNWAAFSTGNKRGESGFNLSIFVGDLASDVTDLVLHETFASRYPSVKGAKVVIDSNTGRSKGYGFVRFGDENERSRAVTEMNGIYCSTRPMRIGVATPKKQAGHQQDSSQALVLTGGYASNGSVAQSADPSNTTVFVGGLDSDVRDEDLRQPFSQYGEVVSIKIPAGKGCGFVQFANRSSAEDAMQRLNGTVIGKQKVRLSWGRSPWNKQPRMYSNNQPSGAYYGMQGYGYAVLQNEDMSVKVAAGVYGAASDGYANHTSSQSAEVTEQAD
ncbi:hypothetical protein NMG60_11019671 [Bertholletia excelsa]